MAKTSAFKMGEGPYLWIIRKFEAAVPRGEYSVKGFNWDRELAVKCKILTSRGTYSVAVRSPDLMEAHKEQFTWPIDDAVRLLKRLIHRFEVCRHYIRRDYPCICARCIDDYYS